MFDFTLNRYKQLIEALIAQGYDFQTFHEYITNPGKKSIVLRHDVDARPQNSLILAEIEHDFGIRGTYNFRSVAQSWDEKIIHCISKMGHEIGYHYEELSTFSGNAKQALEAFDQNLERLRQIAPVSTICMHGSPRSKHDSRDLWKQFDYKDLNIIGEPYLDVDFTKVLYLTDTGRKWDGERVSIRDRVNPIQKKLLSDKGYFIRNTNDIIKAANDKALPDQLMITIHPQRWHRLIAPWVVELLFQKLKNVVKGALNIWRK